MYNRITQSSDTFIYDTAEMMRAAWARARRVVARDGGDLRAAFATALRSQWSRARNAMQDRMEELAKAIRWAAQEPQRTVILLADAAEGDKIGRSWTCTYHNVRQHDLPQAWIGEEICYRYA